MAAPGENFPMQFALGILNLAQQNKQREAELAEMRNSRAASNFLEKERLRLQEQGQFIQQQQFGEQMAFNQQRAQMEAETQKIAAEERIRLEGEKLRLERDQLVVQSVSDFGRTGTAFIPSYAAGKVPELMSSASSDFTIASINIPGAGTLLQRINDPEKRMEYELLQSKIDASKQDAALNQVRAQDYTIRQQQRADQIRIAGNRVSQADYRLALQRVDQLRKLAESRIQTLAASANPADRQLAMEAARDPKFAFPEGSPERSAWEQGQVLLTAWDQSRAANLPIPPTSDVEALRSAGVNGFLYGDSLPVPAPAAAPSVKIVGRIKDESGNLFLIGEHGERIPTTDESTPISMIGAVSQTAPPAQTPAATGKRKATPEDEAEATRLLKLYQKDRSPEIYAKLAKLQAEIEF